MRCARRRYTARLEGLQGGGWEMDPDDTVGTNEPSSFSLQNPGMVTEQWRQRRQRRRWVVTLASFGVPARGDEIPL